MNLLLFQHPGGAHEKSHTLRRIALFLRSAAFFVLVVLTCGIYFFVPAAPTIAVIQATTEYVGYEVAAPDLVQIKLAGYALTYESGGDTLLGVEALASPTANSRLCLTGVLAPTLGARVSYRRRATGALSVVIERTDNQPAAVISLATGQVAPALQKAPWIRLEAPPRMARKIGIDCAGDPADRLPLYGPTRIGTPLRPEGAGEESASGVLLQGTIDVFAKSVNFGWFPDDGNRIYPTAINGMTIPPGSQISEFLEKNEKPKAWAGFVKVGADEALDVRVTTPAGRIQIMRPGIGLTPDLLVANLFAQLTNDPMIVSLQFVAVFIYSILQVASSMVAARASPQPKE